MPKIRMKPSSMTSAPKTVTRKALSALRTYSFSPEEADEPPARDGGDLPEHVEEDQVARKHQPHHRAEEQDHHQVVFVLVLVVADVPERIDDDQESHERGDDGHEDRQRVDDQDKVQTQDEHFPEDGLAAREGRRDEEHGQERGDGAEDDGPGRPRRLGQEPHERDGQGADDWDKNREQGYCLNVHCRLSGASGAQGRAWVCPAVSRCPRPLLCRTEAESASAALEATLLLNLLKL